MPKAKKEFKEVGAVRRVVEMPCAVPPLIYLATFKPALMDMIHSNIEPVWKQEIKIATGKSWLKHLKGYMSNAHRDLPPLAANGLEKLYVAAEFLDKATFYLWVADMAETLVYNWASLIHEFTPCHKSPHDQIASGANCTGGFIADGVWRAAPPYVRTFGSGGGLVAPSPIVPKSAIYEMMQTVHWPPTTDGTYQAALRVRNGRTGEIVALSASATTSHEHGADTLLYSPHLQAFDHDTQFFGEAQLIAISGTVTEQFPESGNFSLRKLGRIPVTNPKQPKEHAPRPKHSQQHAAPFALGTRNKGTNPKPKMVGKIRMCWIDGRWQPCPLQKITQSRTTRAELSTKLPKK